MVHRGAGGCSRFDRHGEISIAEAVRSGAPNRSLTDAVTMSEAPNHSSDAGQRRRLKIESNSILSNLMKNRVVLASILSKTLPSSPTPASRLSVTV
jgi:hypothetical protein